MLDTIDPNDPTSSLLSSIQGEPGNVNSAHTENEPEKTSPVTPLEQRIERNNKERHRRVEKKKRLESTMDSLLSTISDGIEEDRDFNRRLLDVLATSSSGMLKMILLL